MNQPSILRKNGVFRDNESASYFLNGRLHREDGPAIEYNNGDKFWCLNGRLHREDGPAIEYSNGDKYWYNFGFINRLNGPAIECHNGELGYYIKDIVFRKEVYDKIISFPPRKKYHTNKLGITFIRLEDNLGLRVSLLTELWYNGIYKILKDEDLEKLIDAINRRKPFLNPVHDYILEKYIFFK
jgi:hypothetical protein